MTVRWRSTRARTPRTFARPAGLSFLVIGTLAVVCAVALTPTTSIAATDALAHLPRHHHHQGGHHRGHHHRHRVRTTSLSTVTSVPASAATGAATAGRGPASGSAGAGAMAFTGLGGGIRAIALAGGLSLVSGIVLLAAVRIPALRRRLAVIAKKRQRRIARA